MTDNQKAPQTHMPDEETFTERLRKRHRRSKAWRVLFLVSTLIGLVALGALFINVVDEAFGMVAVASEISEADISDTPLAEMTTEELAAVLVEYVPRRLAVIIRDELSQVASQEFTSEPMSRVLSGAEYPEGVADLTIRELSDEQLGAILAANLSGGELRQYVVDDVIGLDIFHTWTLTETIFNRKGIETEFAALVEELNPPNPELRFRSWLNKGFITNAQSSYPEIAGVRTAVIGTLWIMVITMTIAFPLGVGAAIYLEEYAQNGNILERVIEVNIRNLAGVPSIIYGLLGLAIFVRALEQVTSGAFLGGTESNGRTILSASATMALLILPVIIISAQEAIRAVPQSIREASYGLGATKWQTIWRQVLPAAMPGILTGTILSMSRAIGETAPLIVVGASAVIFVDPTGPFSKFTALPIQIWQWTARPQAEFRNIAAAAIIVLLGLLLVLNSAAIILRQRLSSKV